MIGEEEIVAALADVEECCRRLRKSLIETRREPPPLISMMRVHSEATKMHILTQVLFNETASKLAQNIQKDEGTRYGKH